MYFVFNTTSFGRDSKRINWKRPPLILIIGSESTPAVEYINANVVREVIYLNFIFPMEISCLHWATWKSAVSKSHGCKQGGHGLPYM